MSPGLVVMGDNSWSEVKDLNPGAVYWMDITFFILIFCKNYIDCLKRPKISKKEAGVVPFIKNFWPN